MKLLIEDFPYPASKVRGLLGGEEPYENDGLCRINNVGYFYNPEIRDCVFILPKVLLDYHPTSSEDTIFGKFHPTDLVDFDIAFRNELLNSEERDFIYNFSTWIYRAIAEFVKINESLPETQRSRIVYKKHFSNISLNGHNTDGTLIDIILSLIKFSNENKEFFMYIIKNIHRGYNKIHWNRTIVSKQAIIHDGVPHYVEVINKKKNINFDEELLIIFYSILNYIKAKFGFPINIPFNYELITGPMFESYLSGLGRVRLLNIKYKYFSDKTVKLWNLCYCFFAMIEQINSNPDSSEYLMVSDFNIVFETMIDTLLSDKNIPAALRDQRDGKIVDHIYRYESLISPTDIYHIGDSKYYKIGGSVHGHSEYKQYTYARNVIQYNLELFLQYGSEAFFKGALPYLDTLTDGYNVTPNFFISAEIDKNFSYIEPGVHEHLSQDGKNYAVSKQFDNRLFDRDTLWLAHYDINFLYVLALFVSPYESVKEEFKEETRLLFRRKFIALLNNKYSFFRFNIRRESIAAFIISNFRELTGKIFHYNGNLILALEKEYPDTIIIREKYSKIITEFQLI